ncbi:MAG TPA: acyl-CoA dehydrogenase family protein, partial [Candidatus Binataceae bacterium]|nr:acyl-CoA dehydrogenase family protein [Candidatus Binataceae bacterium]
MQPDHISSSAEEIFAAVTALEPQIRESAPAIEAERRLPPALAQALMRAGIFRMGVPQAYGGPELDPMSQ